MLKIEDYTESEIEELAVKRKKRKKSITLGRRSTEPIDVRPFPSRDRWENWDTLSDYEDFWITVDEVNDRRMVDTKDRAQNKSLERKRQKRLERKKIDMDQFMADEPYADMCNKPRQRHNRITGCNPEARKHAEEDRKIIAENRFEIERILREKPRSQSDIAREFGISLSVLRKVIKGWAA